jgi:ComF family protein
MLTKYASSVLHLFYPHICPGCGSDKLSRSDELCLTCRVELPFTNFETIADNTIEKIFYGRMQIQAATSLLYFSKGTLVQRLIHQFKYKANTELGSFLGTTMGQALQQASRFSGVDCVVPLPLFAKKQEQRGFNQAAVLTASIANQLKVPAIYNNVIRQKFTQTQTKKHRTERWQNVAESFVVANPAQLQNKHVLLVDDVITTGATIEACAQKIASISNTKISVATLAYASK